jgi:signal transduction histidine kinase
MALNELAVETVSVQRREKLIQFLVHANRNLAAFVEKLENKLDNIAGRAAHVEGILPERDELSFQGKPVEEVHLDKLVKDAMDLMPEDLRSLVHLKLHPSTKEKGTVKVHRISLRQVITNLLTNAAESIERTGATSGQVEIRAVTQQVDGVDMIHFTVCDDGQGIEAADLDRIFQRGFTTKRKRAWGIGLHWCANTMAAMKGRLFAESKGIGHGACFHLVFPENKQTLGHMG